jgi:NADPH:quinone reductase-like Zn-dependent oxidoreductase
MRAVVIRDGALTVEERPDPSPGPRDVVVEVRAAGLNSADLLQRRGLYPAPPGSPADVPGLEVAGVIVDRGDDVVEWMTGERVCAVVGAGAQAEKCLVPSEHLLRVPPHVSWEEAGGFPEAYTTAFDALRRHPHLRQGSRVLVSGAAGGVGTAAVQLAAALGAEVVAVTRDDAHHDELRRLGAAQVTTIDEVDLIDPVDVVIELVGAAHLVKAQSILAPRATVIVIGVGGGGGRIDLDLLGIMSRRAVLTGSTLRSRSRDEKAEVAADMTASVLPLWAQGKVGVTVARTWDLSDVDAAYTSFADRGKFGKLILTNGESAPTS